MKIDGVVKLETRKGKLIFRRCLFFSERTHSNRSIRGNLYERNVKNTIGESVIYPMMSGREDLIDRKHFFSSN